MNIDTAMSVSGFLFLFILVTFLGSGAFGSSIGFEVNADDKLKKINDHPNKFKISIVLVLMSALSVITLGVILFIAFNSYNLILGVIWTVFRTGEGLIIIYNEINYWRLLNIARQYSGTSSAEKKALSDLARTILQTRNSRFTFSQLLFGIGTLTYSILFVTYGAVPLVFGWLGLVAGVFCIFANGVKLIKPDFKVLGNVGLFFGAMLALPFEAGFGVWLLFLPH
ncbi:DUF4386 domain-containing protein [Chloroflexota bacterium]